MRFPSGEKATAVTREPFPWSVARCAPVTASHSSTSLYDALNTTLPSGEKPMEDARELSARSAMRS